jgi:hypothetical protein
VAAETEKASSSSVGGQRNEGHCFIVGLLCWLLVIKFGSLELPVLVRYPLALANLVIF